MPKSTWECSGDVRSPGSLSYSPERAPGTGAGTILIQPPAKRHQALRSPRVVGEEPLPAPGTPHGVVQELPDSRCNTRPYG